MPARARWSHQWSVRGLVALGLVVPLACLLVLWVFGTDVTMTRARAEHEFATADQLYTGPTRALSSALAAEQLQAVNWLIVAKHDPPFAPVQAQFGATDLAAASFVAAARTDAAVIPAAARPELRTVESLLAGRVALRAAVRASRLSVPAAVRGYGAILSAVVSFEAALLVVDDGSLARQAAATVEADRAVALVSSEITLASGAVEEDGAMSSAERELFAQDAAGARQMLTDALTVLNPALGSGYQRAKNSDAYRAFAAFENRIAASVDHGSHLRDSTVALAASSTAPLIVAYQAGQRQDGAGLASLVAQASRSASRSAVLVTGLGGVAVLLSVALATWLWWRIGRVVTRLQVAPLWPGDERFRQLAEADRSQAGATDGSAAALSRASPVRELAGPTAALPAPQQAAPQAGTSPDQLGNGAGQLFRHLGERGHALARRQLRLLAVVERGTSDPQRLAELTALRQLSIRLQRHADGLLALSGGAARRTDVASLAVGDLLRAAAAEVDDGSRIAVVSDTHDAVTADAVPDVLLLITELAENAVQHTPPLADVTFRAGRVGRGLAIEIEDHGPGFTEERLESANALLARPPEIGTVVPGPELGLLVTARLAARHGITVSIRSSRIAGTAGTTAIVVLPHELLITGEVRDSIVDGSPPRVDGLAAPASLALPGPPAAPVPAASVPTPGPAEPVVPEPAVPAAENLAPWHWLTKSEPAPTSAPSEPARTPVPETPDPEAGVPRPGDAGAPTPLPRRIPPTSPRVDPGASAAAASPGPDQAPAAGAAGRESGDAPVASLPDEPSASVADEPPASVADEPSASLADEQAVEP